MRPPRLPTTTKRLLLVAAAAVSIAGIAVRRSDRAKGGGFPFPVALAFRTVVIGAVSDDDDPGSSSSSSSITTVEGDGDGDERVQVLQATAAKKKRHRETCRPSRYDPTILRDPCALDEDLDEDGGRTVPERFSLVFPTQYGRFTARCVRSRAPVWADRVYRLAKSGYYDANYFFRVLPGRYAQFGTNGHPDVSNVYNYTSPLLNKDCSILEPQPPFMPYCMAHHRSGGNNGSDHDCDGVEGLSNDYGTLSMSTSYKMDLEGYPNGVTWNATAELFLNIGEGNRRLDDNLFVPICEVDRSEMDDVVLRFPSFGEVSELGGDGPSLGRLYEEGNPYIESNPDWKDSMALTGTVEVCS